MPGCPLGETPSPWPPHCTSPPSIPSSSWDLFPPGSGGQQQRQGCPPHPPAVDFETLQETPPGALGTLKGIAGIAAPLGSQAP